MRWKPVSLIAAGLLVAGLASGVSTAAAATSAATSRATSSAAAPGAFAAQPVDFHRCADSYLRERHAQCGLLTVPLDPANPTGPTIQVGVSRVLHTKGPYRGAIFTNAGGPGGSGLFLATYGKYVPDKVGLSYDWYGFDPRGIGTSRPLVSCDKHYFEKGDRDPYKPSTPSILSFWQHKTQAYAAACGTSTTASLMQHDTTLDTVADYEVLRESIGADQVTWFGGSYGTYVGEVYATLHPERLKAMVLDGVIGPDAAWYQANLDQNVAFQKPFEKFLAWMAKYPRIFGVGDTPAAVERTYHRLHRQLTKHPLAHGTFGPDELDDSLQPAAYYNVTWLDEGKAFSLLATQNQPRLLVKAWRGGSPKNDDNGYAGYLATECTDAPWPADYSTWAADAKATQKSAPFETWGNTWFNMPCRTWPFAASPQFQVDGSKYTGPVIMTEQSLDPATPYAGALAARNMFPTSRLVVGVGGTSHAVSLYGVKCTDNTIANVLRDGSLPPRRAGSGADKKCQPLKPPVPMPLASRSGTSARTTAAAQAGFPWRRLLPYALRAQHLG